MVEDADKLVVCDGVIDGAPPGSWDALKELLTAAGWEPIVDSSGNRIT